VTSWLQHAAEARPATIALEAPRGPLTYAELYERAAAGARALEAGGVRAREAVALEHEDRIELAIALHACLLHGAAAVPIDPRLGAGERAARAAIAGTIRGDEVATVMHTSGTTAAPKPVELTYGNWLANALGSAVALGLDQNERWLCTMPLAHVGGLSILIRSAIYATTVVLHERFESEAVLRALSDPEERITVVSLVPTMLARLLDAGLREPPSLRWALLGGGPIAPSLLARAQAAGVPVAPTYGMTEACSQIATHGRPLPGVELAIAPDGEILVRGPIVAPAAPAADGWLHTGDLGAFDDSGALQVIGRKADTIVSGGENVAPAEVEAVLLEHPCVADAAVFARSDAEWGEVVVAAVIARDGTSPRELRQWCRERLAPFKVPKTFELRSSLPRTDSGKLLRREL
jgi:O-succinylbenzoic acid--CoA ligase